MDWDETQRLPRTHEGRYACGLEDKKGAAGEGICMLKSTTAQVGRVEALASLGLRSLTLPAGSTARMSPRLFIDEPSSIPTAEIVEGSKLAHCR